MDEEITTEQVRPGWCIDLDWFQQNERSFSALAQSCLCPKCQERLKGEISAADLLATIKDCCSKTPGFITGELPILESVFRLFLANGNQPLDLEELGRNCVIGMVEILIALQLRFYLASLSVTNIMV